MVLVYALIHIKYNTSKLKKWRVIQVSVGGMLIVEAKVIF
jgi:hypothetical protein